MAYTSDEITRIHLLAQDTDLKNALLALQLIKGRGIVPQLLTDLYWIYNRVIWAGEQQLEKEVYLLLEMYWSTHSNLQYLTPLLIAPSSLKQTLHSNVERQAQILGLDLVLLAQLLYNFFPLNHNPMNGFLFKYGTETMQKQILPFLKFREHTGRFFLDLGGLKLKYLPEAILAEKDIQVLKIWGNDLKQLPDIWDHFPHLEVLNIAENQLQGLPKSFIHLQQLQKLYAQNNTFVVPQLLETIQQLPNIKYLSVANPPKVTSAYNLAEQKQLRQFEKLINHGKIYASEKEQNLFLALFMKEQQALNKLTLTDLFQALSDSNATVRQSAKQKILNWKGATFNGQLPTEASIAILGIVSFATRTKLNHPNASKWHFTTEINPSTTHIIVGDYPENYAEVEERPFIFMTEEDL